MRKTLKVLAGVGVVTVAWVAIVLMPIVNEREEMEYQGAQVDGRVFFLGATLIAICPALVTAVYYATKARIRKCLWLFLLCAFIGSAVFLGGTFLAASGVSLSE